jgi:hypothetical protein
MDKRVSYLVRTESADATSLHLFAYDPRYDIEAQGELVAYLTSIIELNRYATGPAITGVWRWNPDDTRDEMHLNLVDTRPEMDRQDEVWTIIPRTGDPEVIDFTVSIDRRNQQ